MRENGIGNADFKLHRLRRILLAMVVWMIGFSFAHAQTQEPELPRGLYFGYLGDSQTESAAYEQAVANILSAIGSGWTDEEKVIYIHDYIVTHCQYDYTYSKYSASNVILDHSAVCNGYSLAFQDLATRAGIETYFVISRELNHAWNMVVLNGKHYYVDCTWDDPGTGGENHFYDSYCRHNNLLQSQESFVQNKHTSTDWQLSNKNGIGYEEIYNKYNDKTYDNACWKTASYSPMICGNGYMLFLNSTNGTVYRYNGDPAQATKIVQVGRGGYWPVYGMDGYYYSNTYGTLTARDNLIYVNDYQSIYRLDLAENTLYNVYDLSQEERASGFLYGIDLQGSRLKYDIGTGYSDSQKVSSNYLDLSNITGIVATDIQLSKSQYTFKGIGQSITLTASVTPSQAGVDSWISSDTSVAVVENGTVKSVGYGKARITAKTGKLQAFCDIYVDTEWQDAYESDIYGDKLRIKRYIGGNKVITIPAVAYVDGAQYKTFLQTLNSTVAETVAFEPGVELGENSFQDCITLKKADLSGAVFGNFQTNQNFFSGCTSLEEITVPQKTESDNRIPELALPMKFYIKNSDGTTSSQSYTDLGSVPAGSVLVNKANIKINLSTPQIAALANVNSGVQIKWNAVSGAEKYRVFQKNANGVWEKIGDTTGLSFTHTGVTAGTTYTYTLRCLSADGKKYTSSYNNTGKSITYQAPVQLSTPQIAALTNVNGGVQIKWNAVSGAEKYRVFQKNANGVWEKIGDTTGLSFTHTGVTAGTTYTYTLRCLSADGKKYTSSYNNTGKSITYQAPVQLSTPQIAALTNVNGGVQIKWNAVSGAEKYRVFQKNANGVWEKIGDTTGLSFTHTGVTAGTTYTYTLRCLSADGKKYTSSYNNTGKSITYQAPVQLSTPQIAELTNVNGGVQIKWNAVSGAEKYRVFQKNANGVWEKIGDTTGLSFTHTGVTAGTTYTYTLRCLSADGKKYTSSYNNTGKSITYQAPVQLSTPQIAELANVNGGVQIKWNAVSGAEKYRVFQKNANGVWEKIGDTTGLSFTHTGVTAGTTYTYTLRCLSADGKKYTSSYNNTGKSITYYSSK